MTPTEVIDSVITAAGADSTGKVIVSALERAGFTVKPTAELDRAWFDGYLRATNASAPIIGNLIAASVLLNPEWGL